MKTSGSRAPLWLTLGFAVGLGFGWLAFGQESSGPSAAATEAKAGPAKPALPNISDLPRDAARLGELEELFQTWGGYCIWKNNVTQFAVWNRATGRHSDFCEVRRTSRKFYFRTLPKAEWPLIDHGEMVRCPLWFAETPEMREQFYREHPEVVPGQPILKDLAKRPPLLPPLPPKSEETNSGPPPRRDYGPLTPGAGG
jgi:hypothetical protein